MHKKLTKRKHNSKAERSVVRPNLYRRAPANLQAMPCMTKLIANKKQSPAAANDANYYESTQKEAIHAFA